MGVDKVLLEILNNRFTGIVEEMGYVIHRAAFTTFVKETWDFDSALISPQGEVFCYPRNIGVTNMLSIDLKPAIDCFDRYEPGDVVLTNDPVHTRGMSTHLPDLMMFRPLFDGDRLVCFAWCFVHSSDVGGFVPGSIWPQATDRLQEGVIIPPIKLFKGGRLDEELRRFVLANCRIPEQNWGDLSALTAALATADRRMAECCAQYGTVQVAALIDGLIEYGEARARHVLEKVPDGEYRFSDYLEGDSLGTHHVRLKLRMVVKGSDVCLDFTGTDPQVNAAFNLPTMGRMNQFLVLGLVNFLRTSDPEIPFNRGIVHPVQVVVPEGSLLNPTRFAATGVRYTTALRISDLVMGALSQAVPDRIPAAGSGNFGLLTLSDLEPHSGTYVLHVLEPLQGGSGGRPGKDGIDGMNFSGGALRNAPVEALELDSPILVTGYRLADRVAAGQWRGGSGIMFECQLLSPHAQISSRGWDRFWMRPWGREGGDAGPLGEAVVIDAAGVERRIPKIDVLKLAPGETVRVTSPGGGGYGDPLERAPTLVQRDVEDGFVDAAEARERYGVVLGPGGIDEAATAAQRREMRAAGCAPVAFEYGAERRSYESTISEEFQDLVASVLAEEPPASRLYLRDILYARRLAGSAPQDRAGLERIIGELGRATTSPLLPRRGCGKG